MKRRILVCLLVLVVSQLPAAAQGQEDKTASSQKVIRDPAEYNAYIKALNTPDPLQKAAGMEAFIAAYPNSVVEEDALEQAMSAYQQANKPGEVERVVKKIVELDAGNVRALAILVALTRARMTGGSRDITPAGLRTLSQRGLRALEAWEMPAGLTQDDFDKVRNQAKVIFYGGLAFAALQQKDYPTARDHYTKALEVDPGDIEDTYQLSIAYLEMTDIDIRGFWHVARAIHLAEQQHNGAAVNAMAPYGKGKYQKYHGSLEGWDEILSRAGNANVPPRDFNVTKAPAASGTSGTSPGTAHRTPASTLSSDTTSAAIASPPRVLPRSVAASALSSDTTPAGIASPPQQSLNSRAVGNGVSASLLSSGSPGNAHRVSASVLSSNSVPASITSPAGGSSDHLVRFGKTHHPLLPVPIFLPANR